MGNAYFKRLHKSGFTPFRRAKCLLNSYTKSANKKSHRFNQWLNTHCDGLIVLQTLSAWASNYSFEGVIPAQSLIRFARQYEGTQTRFYYGK